MSCKNKNVCERRRKCTTLDWWFGYHWESKSRSWQCLIKHTYRYTPAHHSDKSNKKRTNSQTNLEIKRMSEKKLVIEWTSSGKLTSPKKIKKTNKPTNQQTKPVKRKPANKQTDKKPRIVFLHRINVVIVLNKCTSHIWVSVCTVLYMFYGRSFPLTTTQSQSQSFNPIDLSVSFLVCICTAVFALLLNRTTKMDSIALVLSTVFSLDVCVYP